jgi:hypothetical protein
VKQPPVDPKKSKQRVHVLTYSHQSSFDTDVISGPLVFNRKEDAIAEMLQVAHDLSFRTELNDEPYMSIGTWCKCENHDDEGEFLLIDEREVR